MEVLIVSKTHMADNACVGGLVLDNNRYVRLLNRGNRNQPTDTDLQIGQIWDINFITRDPLAPPHVEDIIVLDRDFVGVQNDLSQVIRDRDLVDWNGSINDAFDGLLRWTQPGSGYISPDGELPNRSVGFWISDRDMTRYDNFQTDRYRYPSANNNRTLKFVGYQTPIDVIPVGTIIRLSLTRIFTPPNDVTGYWLQLSGWY